MVPYLMKQWCKVGNVICNIILAVEGVSFASDILIYITKYQLIRWCFILEI